MQKIDHKHFTNNIIKTMNVKQDAVANAREKEDANFSNIINNDNYFLFVNNNPFQFISNVDDFRIADMDYQNQHFADDKVNIDCTKNAPYSIMDYENNLWMDTILDFLFYYCTQMPICPKYETSNYQDLVSIQYNENILAQNISEWIISMNNFILQFINKCSYNGNETNMIQLNEYSEMSNKITPTSHGTVCTKGDMAVVPYNYYIIIKPSEFMTFFNTLICCTNLTIIKNFRKTKNKHDCLPYELSHKIIAVPNIEHPCFKSTAVACLEKPKRISYKPTQFSNFLRILLVCAYMPKKARTDYIENNALSIITQNWYIQDIIHGYIIDMLQKKMKATTLYYIAKQYFVILVNFTPNLIIEVNETVKKGIFTIYNINLYQEISDWYRIGKSMCIDTMEKVTKFFVKIFEQESIIKAITFTKSYQNELGFCEHINCLSEQKCVENVIDKKPILNCVSITGLNEVIHERPLIYTSDFVKPTYTNEAINEIPFDCMAMKTNDSSIDIYDKKSDSDYISWEIEEIDEFICEVTNTENDDLINDINTQYDQAINVVENDLPISEYQPTFDLEPTEVTENYTDNQYKFSESESLMWKLSKSSILLQKVKGKTLLKDDNDNEISTAKQTCCFRKSDAEKIIDNVFDENHNIYNAYYLHSKHWLTKLFKEPQVKTKFDYQKELFSCQRLNENISDNTYMNLTKNDPFQHRHDRLKTATEFYWQNHATMHSYYMTFMKCLGKSLLNIFCNVNI